MKFIVTRSTKPKAMLPGFISSLKASYTVQELEEILKQTSVKSFKVTRDPVGLSVISTK